MNDTHATATSVSDAVIDSTLAGNDGYIRAESRPATQNNAAAAAAAAAGMKRTQSGRSGGGGGGSSGSIRNLLLPTPVSPFGGRNAGWADQKPSEAAAAAAIIPKAGRPLTSPKPKGVVLNHQGSRGNPNRLPQAALQPYNTAIFYSECHLAGISPENAERAVESASEQYQRWWVEALRRKSSNDGVLPGDICRLSSSGALDDSSEDGTADGSRLPVRSRAQRRPNSKKLRKSQSNSSGGSDRKVIGAHAHGSHRAAMREVIDRVAKRQEEQGGGYLSPVTAPNYTSDYSSSVSSCRGLKTTNSNHSDAAALVSSTATSVAPTTDESSGAEEVAAHARNHATKGDVIVSGRDSFGALSISPKVPEQARRQAMEAKSALLSSLASTGGDVTHPSFVAPLAVLEEYYKLNGVDARAGVLNSSRKCPFGSTIGLRGAHDSGSGVGSDGRQGGSSAATVEGTWLSLSRPDYTHCLGKNDKQHYVYTLGRLSFDMFRPTSLRCSIQGEFNTVNILEGDDILPEHVPRKLQKEVLRCKHSRGRLLTYNIVVAFVIEPNQDRHGNQIGDAGDTDGANTDKNKRHHPRHRHRPITRPIRGIMTNLGFMLPDPKTPNRMSVWFTEGQLEVNDEEEDLKEWQRIFDNHGAPKRALRERAHMLAAKLFLGADVPDQMDEDGTMRYELKRPIGGHGLAFTDVLYLDDDLRILRGHHGQIYVCARVLTGESAAALQAVERKTAQSHNAGGTADRQRDREQGRNDRHGSAFQVSA